ncbi:LOW QUALITY PROTEIN: ventricular zone-expressed PH domain-containing protein homolog 1-like [Amphiura filiformis]|uniref:LOW QUALITY PROTEIN: ventricular zone-expressed PH domain-containing protein homolog 1-like n=1 Tax=Amphiura filiformis TaxID=82378 RepID=UPI003B227920
MHELFAQVLSRRSLRAGDLFAIPDSSIVNDLSEALFYIEKISSSEDYLRNDNDQAVVEICITRVTTAIRDTASIEQHAHALVSLWDSCLQHNLRPSARDEDPPHAKIASDIMSCLFMQNYNKKNVMKLVLPVAVRFLQQGNREICRNMSSYLSLAAIDNAELLATHSNILIRSIINGNRSLTRILPQIYSEKPEEINAYVSHLLAILPLCDETDQTYLIQLTSQVAKHSPKLLIEHIPLLICNLTNSNTSQTVLTALTEIAAVDAAPFTRFLGDLTAIIDRQPALLSMAVKIFGAVGRLNQETGRACMAYMVDQLPMVDQTALPAILIEIKSISDQHEGLLGTHIAQISLQADSSSTAARMIIQQLQDDMMNRQQRGLLRAHITEISIQPDSTSTVASMVIQRLQDDMRNRKHQQLKSSSSHDIVKAPSPTVMKKSSTMELDRSITDMVGRRQHYRKQTKASHRGSAEILGSSQTASTPSLQGRFSPEGKSITSSQQSVIGRMDMMSTAESRTSLQTSGSNLTPPKGRVIRPVASPTSPSRSWDMQKRIGHKETSARIGSYSHIESSSSRQPSHNGSSLRLPAAEGSMAASLPVGGGRDSSLQQYLSKRQKEISSYMDSIRSQIPIPEEFTVHEAAGHRPVGKLDFYCSKRASHCLYSDRPYTLKTKEIQPWIHLKFLHLQATSPTPVSLDDRAVQSLRKNWERQKAVGGTMTFLKLITQNFPSLKVQQSLVHQLLRASWYDMFTYDPQMGTWTCFLCSSPHKMDLLSAGERPLIEGQLKEKRVRWKLFKRWRTRYFTLAGEQLLYAKTKIGIETKSPIELSKVQSVKTVRRRDRSIPRAFEIFTDDKTYTFKAKDGKAEQWVQCLTLAMRQAKTDEEASNISSQ